MLADDARGRREMRDQAHQLRAEVRMLAEQLPLGRVERAVLGEDPVGDDGLAHVVEASRDGAALLRLLVEPERARGEGCPRGHRLRRAALRARPRDARLIAAALSRRGGKLVLMPRELDAVAA